MNINEVKTAFKIADVVLYKEHKSNYIKLNYLKNLKNEDGKEINSNILRKRIGFVYLIVVDDIIMKIGGSQGKGGIKATMGFYASAMQGGPSIRSYGIHLLMKKAIDEKKKVEIYVIISNTIKTKIKGLFSEEEGEVVAFHEMEEKCKEDYFGSIGKYPDWNFQSKGKGNSYRWPEWIRKSYKEYGQKNSKKK